MNILIVSATRKNFNDFKTQPLYKSCFKKETTWSTHKVSSEINISFHSQIKEDVHAVDFLVFTENTLGLSKVYNWVVNQFLFNYRGICGNVNTPYDYIVYVHDDVAIHDNNLVKKLKTEFENGNSVLGLAGASSIMVCEPTLWHIMSPRDSWSGTVYHIHYSPEEDRDKIYPTHFGPVPKRCVVIDCLFIAIKVKDILDKNIQFDEQFDFHCVDLDFSLTCNKNKLKISTVPINVVHSSPGLQSLDDPCFQKNQKLFLQKWKQISS